MKTLPLEKQVCSLELAKELNKLLGDKAPESIWSWIEDQRDYKWGVFNDDQIRYEVKTKENFITYPAYTCAELGEMLDFFKEEKTDKHGFDEFRIDRFISEEETAIFMEENEANARAKMLIHLIKEGLIKL